MDAAQSTLHPDFRGFVLITDPDERKAVVLAHKAFILHLRIKFHKADRSPDLVRDLKEEVKTIEIEIGACLERAFETLAKQMGREFENRKESDACLRREQREARTRKGLCVRCPKGNVKPARPDRTTCAECGAALANDSAKRRARRRSRATEQVPDVPSSGADQSRPDP